MKRNATPCNVPAKAKPRIYNKVFDRSHRRIRGLWYRDGKFYSQARINGDVKQIELHEANTIAQAVEAMQVLKNKIGTTNCAKSFVTRRGVKEAGKDTLRQK